ncbi:MAG: hypothetical protein ACLSVD_01765 [Eggerthellaceae bacterium]
MPNAEVATNAAGMSPRPYGGRRPRPVSAAVPPRLGATMRANKPRLAARRRRSLPSP